MGASFSEVISRGREQLRGISRWQAAILGALGGLTGALVTDFAGFLATSSFSSPQLAIEVASAHISNRSRLSGDSISMITSIRDDLGDCNVHTVKTSAVADSAFALPDTIRYAGKIVVYNRGRSAATDIRLVTELAYPGEPFFYESPNANISWTPVKRFGGRHAVRASIDLLPPKSHTVLTYTILVADREPFRFPIWTEVLGAREIAPHEIDIDTVGFLHVMNREVETGGPVRGMVMPVVEPTGPGGARFSEMEVQTSRDVRTAATCPYASGQLAIQKDSWN